MYNKGNADAGLTSQFFIDVNSTRRYAKLYLCFLLHSQVLPLEFIKQMLSVAGHDTFISEGKGIDICHKIRVGSSAMVMVVG
ncbi:hypothetical protein M5J15_06645 [Serratia symbiotica]|uniref:hypothetical protein n=1 Tax=Serratia symbiotica TaxID=138074 RepID=UPI001DDA7F2E|nr:hypothetical protein [Serratia symbiotica]NIG87276.1 hypothetical protein [Serratia symbiotica]USS96534.1 hypothetical protein M5J15_06645 [Serratia symbiotica]